MEQMSNYEVIQEGGVPIKAWIKGVELEDEARQQLINVSKLPFIHKHIVACPDVHWGMGATIGSVIPTYKAIIPAAVGVDIGCGMMAVKTNWPAHDLPDSLSSIRSHIEAVVPHGRTPAQLFERAEQAYDRCTLPNEPNRDAINEMLMEILTMYHGHCC